VAQDPRNRAQPFAAFSFIARGHSLASSAAQVVRDPAGVPLTAAGVLGVVLHRLGS
jgi:hypothetical protein